MRLFRSLVLFSALWILGLGSSDASSLLLSEGKPPADLGQADDWALEPNNQIIYHKTAAGWDNGTHFGGGGGIVDGQQLFDGSHFLSVDAGAHKLFHPVTGQGVVNLTDYTWFPSAIYSNAKPNGGVIPDTLHVTRIADGADVTLTWNDTFGGWIGEANGNVYMLHYGGGDITGASPINYAGFEEYVGVTEAQALANNYSGQTAYYADNFYVTSGLLGYSNCNQPGVGCSGPLFLATGIPPRARASYDWTLGQFTPSSTDTLTNKTIDANSNTLLNLPGITASSTDTLTNKTIDANSNTLLNLPGTHNWPDYAYDSDSGFAALSGFFGQIWVDGTSAVSLDDSTNVREITWGHVILSASDPNIETSNTGLLIRGNASLTGVTMNGLVKSTQILFENCPALSSISFGALEKITGELFFIGPNLNALTAINFPALTQIVNVPGHANQSSSDYPAGVHIHACPALVSFQADALTTAGVFYIDGNPSLTTVSMSSLKEQRIDNYYQVTYITNNPSLTSINLNSFVSSRGISFDGNTSLASLSLPALVNPGLNGGAFTAVGCTALTSLSFPAFLPIPGQAIDFSGCALTAASVNHVLARCVASGAFTSGSVVLSGGTSSAPTGQGITDKATLQGRGVTVNTN